MGSAGIRPSRGFPARRPGKNLRKTLKFTAALFVLLAAAAGARIVAADLGPGADGFGLGQHLAGFADHVAGAGSALGGAGGGAAKGAGGLMDRPPGDVAEELVEGHHA